MARMKSAEVKS